MLIVNDAGLVPFAEGHWFDGTVYYDGRDYYRVIVRSDEEDDERGEDEHTGAACGDDSVLALREADAEAVGILG